MNIFRCDSCEQVVFFESVLHALRPHPRLPARQQVVSALEPEAGSQQRPLAGVVCRAVGRRYRLCRNSTEQTVCNWAVPVDDGDEYCRSCRLNHMIPNLANAGAKEAWHRMEIAKRRLLYTLLGLGLPVETKTENPGRRAGVRLPRGRRRREQGLHRPRRGLITINIAEADDPFREKMRVQMGETYRTVLGHFRHEAATTTGSAWSTAAPTRTLPRAVRRRTTGLRRRRAAALPPGRARRLVESPRQRLRHDAPVGGLGRDLGPLPAHGRRPRDRARLRAVGAAGAPCWPGPSLTARRLDLHAFDDLMTAGSR